MQQYEKITVDTHLDNKKRPHTVVTVEETQPTTISFQ
jgi:hypothetical protein